MAQYMLQNYDAATAAFAGSLAIVPQDDDMYIADVYWLVLSQLRAGQADEAQKTFQQHYRPDMYVGHHTAYRSDRSSFLHFTRTDASLFQHLFQPRQRGRSVCPGRPQTG